MGAFTDISDYVNRMTGGNSGAPENLSFYKYLSTNGGTATSFATIQQIYSLWRFDGIPNAGAAAGAVATCDKSTTGALQFTNSAGSAVKRLVQGSVISVGIDSTSMFVMDRLLACGGLSGTSTSAQTVGGTIGRYTGGTGNQIWLEIQTAIGTTATTVTASYTNENGTSGRTTIARRIGGISEFSSVFTAHQLPLQAGDLGVQSVQSVTLAASTGTVGDFAIVVYHPLAFLVGRMTPQGPFGQLGGVPEIVDDACITFLAFQGGAGTNMAGILSMVDV